MTHSGALRPHSYGIGCTARLSNHLAPLLHDEWRGASAVRSPWHPARTPLSGPVPPRKTKDIPMNMIIYIVGAVVIVIAILSFVGLG